MVNTVKVKVAARLNFTAKEKSLLRFSDSWRDPSKSNALVVRCTREVNRAARWVGNVANIQCCHCQFPIPMRMFDVDGINWS